MQQNNGKSPVHKAYQTPLSQRLQSLVPRIWKRIGEITRTFPIKCWQEEKFQAK